MKIIISPSKTQKPCPCFVDLEKPIFEKEAQVLKKELLTLTPQEIQDIYHLSNNKAQEVYYHLKDQTRYPAIFFYQGNVFKQLHLSSYSYEQMDYLHQHVCILSALYGCLKPFDAIAYYRLDMTTPLIESSLTHYWSFIIKKYFKDEEMIISLASHEFETIIEHPCLWHIDFCVIKDQKIKRPSVLLKTMRGKMLHYMITHQIQSIDALKSFHEDQFIYDPSLSHHQTLVFTKKDVL